MGVNFNARNLYYSTAFDDIIAKDKIEKGYPYGKIQRHIHRASHTV